MYVRSVAISFEVVGNSHKFKFTVSDDVRRVLLDRYRVSSSFKYDRAKLFLRHVKVQHNGLTTDALLRECLPI